jgi:hypothetical protein
MMTSAEPTARIVELIRKLKAHADSAEKIGNAAEAEAFAARVSSLLLKYKLEMTDVELDQQATIDPLTEEMVEFNKWGLEFKRTRIAWQERLAHVLADANFCGLLVLPKSNVIWFVGREADRQVCIYLYATLVRAMKYQSDWDYGQAYREALRIGSDVTELRGYKASWLAGCISSIAERLGRERKALVTDTRGTALVLRAEQELKDHMEKYKKGSPSPRGRNANNLWGALAGAEFGDNVQLKANALNSTGSPALALGDGS